MKKYIFLFESLKTNLSISDFSIWACPLNSSLAAALSSDVAEFVCTTSEIWSTPTVTWAIELASSSDAFAISLTSAVVLLVVFIIFWSDWAVLSTIFVPFSTASIEFSINVDVFFAASADFAARFLTSSATTANPLPASPALAASTAAFNANILVWNAISSIIFYYKWNIWKDKRNFRKCKAS